MNQVLSLTKRVSQLSCTLPGHEDDVIFDICVSPECIQSQRAICFTHCQKLHEDHTHQLIPIYKIQEFIKSIFSIGLTEVQEFNNFKTGILQYLDEMEAIVRAQAALNPLTKLSQIYLQETISHNDINEIGTILSSSTEYKNEILQPKVYKQYQKWEEQYSNIDREFKQILKPIQADNSEMKKTSLDIQKTSIQELTCRKENHYKQKLVSLCFESNCKQKRGVCSLCLSEHHGHRYVSIDEAKIFFDNLKSGKGQIETKKVFEKLKLKSQQQIKRLEKQFNIPTKETIKVYKEIFNSAKLDQNDLEEIVKKIKNNFLVDDKSIKNKENDLRAQQHLETSMVTLKFTQSICEKVEEIMKINGSAINENHVDKALIYFPNQMEQLIEFRNHPLFSDSYKAPQVILTARGSASECIISQKEESDDYFWCISDDPVSNKEISHFNLKILNDGQEYGTTIGLGSRSAMENRNYQFTIYEDKGIENRGLYVINFNGRACQQSKDCVFSTFEFTTGDTIECQYNPETNTFILNNLNQNLSYIFNVDGQETDLHPCVGYVEKGQSVQFMGPEIIENDDEISHFSESVQIVQRREFQNDQVFSKKFKHPEVRLNQLKTKSECLCNYIYEYGEAFWCISAYPVSNISITHYVNNHFFFLYKQKLKIINDGQEYGIIIGLGSKRVMKSQNFTIYDYKGIENRGLYVIVSNGQAYQESKDCVFSTFEFTTGDIIECSYIPETNRFTLNNLNQNLSYIFNVDGQETDLHPCVGYHEKGQSVQFMGSEIIENDDEIYDFPDEVEQIVELYDQNDQIFNETIF